MFVTYLWVSNIQGDRDLGGEQLTLFLLGSVGQMRSSNLSHDRTVRWEVKEGSILFVDTKIEGSDLPENKAIVRGSRADQSFIELLNS